MVGGECKVMREGEMWEINNATLHAVDNQSIEERIHQIIDWVPNPTVLPEHKQPIPKVNANQSKLAVSTTQPKVGKKDPCPCNSGKSIKSVMPRCSSEQALYAIGAIR